MTKPPRNGSSPIGNEDEEARSLRDALRLSLDQEQQASRERRAARRDEGRADSDERAQEAGLAAPAKDKPREHSETVIPFRSRRTQTQSTRGKDRAGANKSGSGSDLPGPSPNRRKRRLDLTVVDQATGPTTGPSTEAIDPAAAKNTASRSSTRQRLRVHAVSPATPEEPSPSRQSSTRAGHRLRLRPPTAAPTDDLIVEGATVARREVGSEPTTIRPLGESDGRRATTSRFAVPWRPLRILASRWPVIATCVLGFAAAGYLASHTVVERYTATANLLLGGTGEDPFVSGRAQDEALIESQIAVLESRALAARVIAREVLYSDRDFTDPRLFAPALDPVLKGVATLRRRIGALTAGILPARNPGPVRSVEADYHARRVGLIDQFRDELRIERQGASAVVRVSLSSHDPEQAARIVNALVDAYAVSLLEAAFAQAARANRWLDEELRSLRESADARGRASLAGRDARAERRRQVASSVVEEAERVADSLTKARARAAAIESRLDAVREVLAGAGDMKEAAEILGISLEETGSSEADSRVRRGTGPSGAVAEGRAGTLVSPAEHRDAALRALILEEIQKRSRARQEALANAERLGRELTVLLAGTPARGESGGAGRGEDDARGAWALFESLSARFSGPGRSLDAVAPPAQVIAYAVPSSTPSVPDRLAFALHGAVVGVVFAFLMVIWRGFSGGGRIEDLDRITDIAAAPVLGVVPGLRQRRWPRRKAEDRVLKQSEDGLAEAVGRLYTGLLIHGGGQIPRVVLVTGAGHGAEASMLALCLARRLAGSGRAAAYIECSFRRPVAARRLDLDSSPGLADFLRGRESADALGQVDAESGATVIVAGGGRRFNSGLLGSEAFATFVGETAHEHDIVVIDGPGTRRGDTVAQLAALADRTLVVIDPARSRRRELRRLVDKVRERGGRVDGIVLTAPIAGMNAIGAGGSGSSLPAARGKHHPAHKQVSASDGCAAESRNQSV